MLQPNVDTEQQRLTGIKIFGWAEIIIGAIGSLIFLILPMFSAVSGSSCQGQGCLPAAVAGHVTPYFVPFLFVLWAGIAVLKFQKIARRINFVIFLLLMIPVALGIIMVVSVLAVGKSGGYILDAGALIPIAILLVPLVSIYWFLNDPGVKKEFL